MPIGLRSIKALETKPKVEKTNQSTEKNQIAEVDIKELKYKDVTENQLLTNSIKENGMLLPIIVAESDSKLIVVDGNKRLKSLIKLGQNKVKASICALSEKKILSILKEFNPVESKENFNIHEEKFKLISGITQSLEDYLL